MAKFNGDFHFKNKKRIHLEFKKFINVGLNRIILSSFKIQKEYHFQKISDIRLIIILINLIMLAPENIK